MEEDGNYYFYHNDHLGTPQNMTSVNGAVVWSTTYSSFGDADVEAGSNVTNNLRFPGQYYDAETGLHYNYHRYYDPSTGRYITPDPIGLKSEINYFAYVRNNSIGYLDPLGLMNLNLHILDSTNYASAEKIKIPDYFTVAGHGNPSHMIFPTGGRLSAEYLATMIQREDYYNKGDKVMLFSCNTGVSPGNGEDSFAQKLADALCAEVCAPNNFISIDDNGKYIIGPLESGHTSDQVQNIENERVIPGGQMVCFKPKSQENCCERN